VLRDEKRKGNIHITYDCIQIVKISAVERALEGVLKLSTKEKARNKDKRSRRRRGMEALSPTATNELNYALTWLLMAQIQNTSRYFLSKQEETV
jgi:hypothetical protein